jgi:flagellar basal-body rod protein FlgB
MWDITTSTAVAALDGLARRGEVRAHNVANAETPGFRARNVEFEGELAAALRRGDPMATQATTSASPTVVDARGNSVDLETEMIGNLADGLHRDTMTAAFNFKTGNLKMAIAGRR